MGCFIRFYLFALYLGRNEISSNLSLNAWNMYFSYQSWHLCFLFLIFRVFFMEKGSWYSRVWLDINKNPANCLSHDLNLKFSCGICAKLKHINLFSSINWVSHYTLEPLLVIITFHCNSIKIQSFLILNYCLFARHYMLIKFNVYKEDLRPVKISIINTSSKGGIFILFNCYSLLNRLYFLSAM